MLHALFLTIVFISSCMARPALLVKKNLGLPEYVTEEGNFYPTVGKDLIVTHFVINKGDAPAYRVVIADDWDTQMFTVKSGLTGVQLDELPPGANYSHSLVVTAVEYGEYKPYMSRVFYQDEKGNQYTSFSTDPGYFYVYDTTEVDKRSGPHLREWSIFVLLCAFTLAGPAYIYGTITLNYVHGIPAEVVKSQKKE